ncbi:MAG: hypothetical protein ABR583_00990 [Gaiellaceae bacterium]
MRTFHLEWPEPIEGTELGDVEYELLRADWEARRPSIDPREVLSRRMTVLPHVIWIGGPPGCGKTTIGRWLAHRYDLQSYNADAHTWEHHDRSLARADPAARRWEALSQDERWVMMEPPEMADFSLRLNAERFRNMVEDVRTLPREPMIVVEGTPLLPWLVEEDLADPASAVWLMPAPEFQRTRLLERPVTTWNATSDPEVARANRIERERLVGEAIERAAIDRRYRVLRVDETGDLEAMKRLVEDALEDVLARGVRASTPEELRAIRRSENSTLLHQVSTYLERVPAAGTRESYAVPFSCECGSGGCDLQPPLPVSAYERIVGAGEFLLAPEHG